MFEASLKEVADCSLEAALVIAQYGKNLLDTAKVLTGFPAFADPRSQLVNASLEVSGL